MKRFVSVFGIFSLAMLIMTIPLVVWFFQTYTIIKTQVAEEFLVLRTEQAKECKEGGGCAVYSDRERDIELRMNLYQILNGLRQNQKGGL